MSEGSLSKRLRDRIFPSESSGKPRLVDVWRRIENAVDSGDPDVTYAAHGRAGWIELKHVHDYPKQATTPIRFKRFTTHQVEIIEGWGRANVPSFVLVQVAGDHWLFDWHIAWELQEGRDRMWWEAHAIEVWYGRLDYTELVMHL